MVFGVSLEHKVFREKYVTDDGEDVDEDDG